MQRALAIAIHIGDTEYHLRCLRMVAVYQLFVGEYGAATCTLENFASIASAEDASALIEGEAHRALGELFLGRLQTARQRLERINDQHLPDLDSTRFVRFLYSKSVDVMNVLSHVQWLMGFPDAATRTAVMAIEYARDTKHELSVANALAFVVPVFFLNGHYEELKPYLAMFEDQVMRYGIVAWRPVAVFYRGALTCAKDHASVSGLDDLKRAIADFRSINHRARMPFYIGVLADALVKRGALGAAEATIEAALEHAEAQNERWCAPELLRIKASLLKSQNRPGEAEAVLIRSMESGTEIGALSWRLRTATDLARLWQSQSRASDAKRILQSIYREFTEGFETRDLGLAADFLAKM
jgi:hypothetical protein